MVKEFESIEGIWEILKMVVEFEGGEDKIEGGVCEGIWGWWGNSRALKAKSYATGRIGTNGGEKKMVQIQKCKLGSYAHNF